MKYNFDEIIDRANDPYSYSMKWSSDTKYQDRICLQTADMDFKTAPAIIEAMINVSKHGIYGYSQPNDEYRKAVCHWFKNRQGWTFNEEDVTFVPGTHTGVSECITRLTNVGDGVIVLTPSYNYHWDIEPNHREFIAVEMIDHDGYYTIDFEALEKAASDKHTTMFIICHPHNPTGRVWNKDELLKMAEICRKHHVIMVTDEVHSDIIRDDVTFEPMMKVVGAQGLVALTAINKTFNLAGLSCTNMIIQDPAIKEKFEDFFTLPSPFAIAAVIAAYTKCSDWVDELNIYLNDNIDYVLNFIKTRLPKARCYKPEGGYIIWIDFRGYGLSDEIIMHKIYDEAHVVVQDGCRFDCQFKGQFIRMCLSSPRSMLEEAFERIAKAFEE